MEDKNKETKLPMFYEQVYSLMKMMVKYYINGEGFVYFRIFKQLYSRIRPDLKKDRQEYYDEKINSFRKYIPTVEEEPYDNSFIIKKTPFIWNI